MKISACRNVDDRSVLARSTDTISNSAHGMDQGIGLLTINLAANATKIDVDDIGCGIEVKVPYVLQQHGARHDLALIADEIFKHLEFTRQKLDFTPRPARRPGDKIKLQIVDAQYGFLGHGIAAPR